MELPTALQQPIRTDAERIRALQRATEDVRQARELLAHCKAALKRLMERGDHD